MMSAPQSPMATTKPSSQSALSNPSDSTAENLIHQSDSLPQHQEGSVASSATGSQTRFSFYNADEFKVIVPPKEGSPVTEKQRFNFYNAEEIKIAQTVVETVEAQATKSNEEQEETTDDDDNNLDSGEILKSLQEHEQQRLEILAGPKKTETESRSNSQTNDNSNPYEDAIKEALQLLRKHRTPSATGGSDRAASQTENEQQTELQQQFQDLLIRTSKTPSAPLTAASAPGHSHEWDDLTLLPSAASMTTPLSETNLGEAYQTEIENRRKQRQERMARYASRLAELKQEGEATTGPPAVDTSQSIDSDVLVANHTNGIARGSSNQQHDWAHDDEEEDDGAASWEDEENDDAIVANRSDLDAAPNVVYPAVSYAGSISTLSNAQKEEEVQRGVERVLLAILERANSRGRSAVPSSSSATYQTASGETQVNQDEEKKSNSVDAGALQQQDDDVLLRAMSEILGRPSAAIEVQNDIEDPSSTSLATQEEHTSSLAAATQEESAHSNDEAVLPQVVVAESSLNLINEAKEGCFSDASQQQHAEAKSIATKADSSDQDSAAHEELDRMAERVFGEDDEGNAETNACSPISRNGGSDVDKRGEKENIDGERRKQANKSYSSESNNHHSFSESDSGTAPDNVYERRRSSFEISANDSGSEFDVDESIQDTTLEDALGTTDDDDEYTSADDDDDDDSSDEYTSDDDESDKFDGVLGPRARRSGGTTGVVLDDSGDESSASSSEEECRPNSAASPPTILESLSAAVSMVTGTKTHDDNQKPAVLATKDKYVREHGETAMGDGDSDEDSEANDLMRSLCAHLLPFGVDKSSRLLDTLPEWDDADPDEPGYRIVRLNSYQLRRVQREYDRMIDRLKRKSQLNLSQADDDSATDETAFERDLRAAEHLLEEEEKRLKTAEKVLTGHSDNKAQPASPQIGQQTETIDLVHETNDEFDGSECLAEFPGVKPAGKGEMGDLEYFSLPVIFKSHVTGFEPTKDMVLEAGNVVAGQYLVEGVLGSAAFSTAYKCIDLNSEEDSSGNQEMVCLKVIKNTKDFFDQSLDEIKILELLRQTGKCHENYIIEMKTFFYHREHLIIVTELLRQNLFEFGKFIVDSGEEPYFTIDRLSYITRQCLVSLNFIHQIGLVHSDVKPENILLGSYSRAQVKLIDFGSSCYLTDRQSSYIQSRSYRAPEVVLGLPYDGRIDVWSLGCVIAEMFTGEVTFQNDSIVSMLSRIEAICGPFPRHMIAHGRQSGRFFTKCGLLFEKVDKDSANHDSSSEDSSDSEERQKMMHFDIFQPKRTSLSSRLGFAHELMEKSDRGKPLSGDERRQAMFADLVRRLLTIDPETRPTAAEALEHPLMLYAATLSEDDIKYPSS